MMTFREKCAALCSVSFLAAVQTAMAGTAGQSVTGFPTEDGVDFKWTTATALTLTVPDGKTYDLQPATITSDELAAATFIKAGDGELISTNKALWNYAGQVVVSSGTMRIQYGFKNNDWHSDVGYGFYNNSSKPLTVASGATLHVFSANGGTDHIGQHFFHNGYIVLGGSGQGGLGALRVDVRKNGANFTLSSFFNHLSLSDDTTLRLETSITSDSTLSAVALNNHTLTVKMPNANTSYVAAFQNFQSGGILCDCEPGCSFTLATNLNNPSNDAYIQKGTGDDALAWVSHPGVTNLFGIQNAYTSGKFDVRLEVPASGLEIRPVSNYTNINNQAWWDIWADQNRNTLDGELRVSGPLLVKNTAKNTACGVFTARGKVSGTGDITVGDESQSGYVGWLQLLNATNDFSGKIKVAASAYVSHPVDGSRSLTGLTLREGALPATNSVSVRNAQVWAVPAAPDGTVEIGQIDFSGDANVTGRVLHATSLRLNEDAGTVSVDGFLLADTVTLAGGTFRPRGAKDVEFSLRPGLHEAFYNAAEAEDKDSKKPTYSKMTVDDLFDRGEVKHGLSDVIVRKEGAVACFWRGDVNTGVNYHSGRNTTYNDGTTANSRTRLNAVSNPREKWLMLGGNRDSHGVYQAYAYEGYMWNRSATNEVWNFIGTWNNDAYFWFDEMDHDKPLFKFPGYTSWNNFRTVSETATVTATPGPHKIRIALYVAGQGLSWGAKGGDTDATRPWYDNIGFSVDLLGRNPIKNLANLTDRAYGVYTDYEMYYTPMLEFANGKMLTLTAETPEDFTLRIGRLAMSDGAEIDTSDIAWLGVDEFSGCGRFVGGGDIRGLKRLTVVGATLPGKSSFGLFADGKVVFDENASFEILNIESAPRIPREGSVVLRAEGGIENLPSLLLDNALSGQGYRLVQSADGKEIRLCNLKGMMLIFR